MMGHHPPFDRDFLVYSKPNVQLQSKLSKLNILSSHVDPMVYPLLFPFGEPGWNIGLEHSEELRFSFNLKVLQLIS